MCSPDRRYAGAGEAVAAVTAGLTYLATVDTADLDVAGQAECLVALERIEAVHTAARARILAAFTANAGYVADGQYGPKPWLRHLTRVGKGAAAEAIGWCRRLRTHPAVAEALTAGEITASWARQLCAWTDRLPAETVADADRILLAAAFGGADLDDLAGLAAEMYVRSQADQSAGDEDGFEDRCVRLETTMGGAGRLTGDLTTGCAAALAAVLASLGAKAGPEDNRTKVQRDHDALEEACQRLIAAGTLPERAGQPVHVQVHIPLHELRKETGAADAEAAWAGRRARATAAASNGSAAGGQVYLTGAAARAAACDATVTPVVTGSIDPAAVDRLARRSIGNHGADSQYDAGGPSDVSGPSDAGGQYRTINPADTSDQQSDSGHYRARRQHGMNVFSLHGFPSGGQSPGCQSPDATSVGGMPADGTRWRLNQALVQVAAAVLSGPGGLAAYLRTHLLDHTLATASRPLTLPLDVGAAEPTIPAHLRRAVTLRDRHCVFPGCRQPPGVCQVHHLVPRADGGATALANLVLVCRFHHLTVVHRWGWRLALHPDGTSTATSPDGRVLRSHPPPRQAA